MNQDLDPGALAKPASRATDKRKAKREADRKKQNVYKFVSARDGYQCRACGRPVKKGGGLLYGGHHHEIRFKSLMGRIHSSNVVLLDSECHADAQAHRLMIEGDADKKLTFENAAGKVWVR